VESFAWIAYLRDIKTWLQGLKPNLLALLRRG
jgi:hypothetical protein